MKLHRLELEGFGPFRARQVVDFDAFERDGIFLITGRTGAGKSSILDGVCFALYGNVPRYESGEKRLRSDHSAPDEPTEVQLEFTADDTRWRVTRSPDYERPKQRGEGMRKVGADAQLDEWVAGEWVGRASGPRTVAEHLDGILQVNMAQFLQVILLAQNRFARFLLADNRERQALLRTLFGTRRFEEYERAFDERRKSAERDLERGGAELTLVLGEAEKIAAEHGLAGSDAADADAEPTDDERDGNAEPTSAEPTSAEPPNAERAGGERVGRTAGDGIARSPHVDGEANNGTSATVEAKDAPPAQGVAVRIEAVSRAVQRARYRVESRTREREQADAAHRAAAEALAAQVALRDAFRQRTRALTALAEIEAKQSGIDRDRVRWELASRAEGVRGAITQAERAERTRESALASEQAARIAWREIAGDGGEVGDGGDAVDGSIDQLSARVDALMGDLALWTQAEREEHALAEREADIAAAEVRIIALERDLAEVGERRAAFPAERTRLDARISELDARAAGLAGAREKTEEAALRLDASTRAAELMLASTAADLAHARAAAAQADATAAWSAIVQRRIDGYAFELARGLAPGEPCAVCGSREHPHPASTDAEPVTPEDVAAAEQAALLSASAERAVAAAAGTARDAYREAAARANGLDVDAARAALQQAEASVADAAQALSDRDALVAERATLVTRDDADALAQSALTAEAAGVRGSLATLRERATESRERVEKARGDFPTVAARRAHAETVREAARDLIAAIRTALDRTAEAARASADRDAQASDAGFATAEDAAAALLPQADRDALDARIRTHETARETERARLRDLELDLAGIEEGTVDVSAAQAATEQALTRWSAAVAATRDAETAAERLHDYASRAITAHEGVAGLAAEHEAIAAIAHAVSGRNTYRMTLETFVLAAELEEIVAAANTRLDEMSAGRFALKHSDSKAARGAASGLGLEVLDAHTGRARPTASLSGGETFLASLALALGLAEVVTARAGGVRLDTLFVDEGFGALDADTLELAMRTLDELRQGGRTVGVISHVEAMKDQLPAQVQVEAMPHGASVIRQAV